MKFAARVMNLQPSAIREILKFTSQPGIIPFAAGNPAPEAFPVEAVREISARILADEAVDTLQYGVSEGYEPLRVHLKAYMRNHHDSFRDDDELIITAGAQQVMDLAAKSLCDEGDAVICESPSFIGSLNAFRSYGLKLRGIPLEADGMDLNVLESALKTEKRARFIYTIPNFQNPAGVTLSRQKRADLYALARRYDMLILEDNPYGDIRFAGEHIPPIKSLDTDGRVIYAGSFSKVLSPGLRVGYADAPAEIIHKMTVCKQVSDVHTPNLSQRIADEFMFGTDFEAHLTRIRGIYRKKAGLMMELADRYFVPRVTYHPVEGGLFLWCRLPDSTDVPAFCLEALQNKVAVVPGSAFLTDESERCPYVRLNFSTPTDAQIAEGMEILGKLLAEE